MAVSSENRIPGLVVVIDAQGEKQMGITVQGWTIVATYTARFAKEKNGTPFLLLGHSRIIPLSHFWKGASLVRMVRK